MRLREHWGAVLVGVCVLMHGAVSSLSVQPGGRPADISHAEDPLPCEQLNPLKEPQDGDCISKSTPHRFYCLYMPKQALIQHTDTHTRV